MSIGNDWHTWAKCDEPGCNEHTEGFPGKCMGGGPFDPELPLGWSHAWYVPENPTPGYKFHGGGRIQTYCPVHSLKHIRAKCRDLAKKPEPLLGYLSLV